MISTIILIISWLAAGMVSCWLWSWDEKGRDGEINFECNPVTRGAAIGITLCGWVALFFWLFILAFWIVFKGIPYTFSRGWFSKPLFNKK